MAVWGRIERTWGIKITEIESTADELETSSYEQESEDEIDE